MEAYQQTIWRYLNENCHELIVQTNDDRSLKMMTDAHRVPRPASHLAWRGGSRGESKEWTDHGSSYRKMSR